MYVCSNCGAQFTKWSGKCSYCGAWGTLEEIKENSNSKLNTKASAAKAIALNKVSSQSVGKRIKTDISEFDRVLGGGFVKGSTVLIGGEPGVGKSTLVSQIMINLAKQGEKVLYISAEESVGQVKRRFDRLASLKSNNSILVVDDPVIENFSETIKNEKPALVVIDSVQAIYSQESNSLPGSLSQIKMAGIKLVSLAKQLNIPFIIIGQITKSGIIAGPKILEHTVDVVLTMTGEQSGFFRLVRATKNRFGSTQEIGVFQMESGGLVEVNDAGKAFLGESSMVSGTAIGAVIEGSRVILVEVQSLVVEKKFEGMPVRRIANGIKKQRLDILSAVLTKRAGIYLGDKDLFVNISSGLTIDNPSLDLAVVASIISAVKDKPIDKNVVFIGEISLTGEIKAVLGERRIISEVKRLGFKDVVRTSSSKRLFVKDIVSII